MRNRFAILFVVLIVLSSFVAAKPLGQTVKDILDSVFEVAEYTFGMKFLPDTAYLVKVEIITRLAVFLIVVVLMTKLFEWFGMTPASSKTIGIALALMSSFAIGAQTLVNVGAVWGGLFVFLLLLIPVILLGIILFAIPTNTKTQIIMKIIVLFVIISILNSQSEVFERSQISTGRQSLEGSVLDLGRRPPFRSSVVGPTADVVYNPPVYYYPPRRGR